MSTATQTRTAQLLSAQQLREQQEISGREGLASLLAAVRRMMDWLLSPFRLVARVLFKPKAVAGDVPVSQNKQSADRAADPASGFDDVSVADLAPVATDAKTGEPEFGGLMKPIAENPDGGLDIEVTGKADDLDAVLPMLMRHIDQILKTHLPSDAQEAQVASHLVALAETAEYSRYAHRLVSREVDGAMKAVVNDPKYVGLSVGTIQSMVRQAAQSPEANALFGEGSAEQRLLARLAVRDKIEADFALQMRQIAVALAPMIGDAKSVEEMQGRGKELLASALQAGAMTNTTLRVRNAAHGARKDLPETLPELQAAVGVAIESVASSMHAKKLAEAAVVAAAEAAAAAAPVAEQGGGTIADTAAPAPATAEVAADVAPVVAEVAVPVAAAPAPAAAPAAPAPAAEAVKAAAVAVQAVRSSSGMFGGATVAQRSAAEMDDVNVIDDTFVIEDGETLVGG